MSSENFPHLYESLLDRMVLAGWIERYARTNAGISIRWTKVGAVRGAMLKELIRKFELQDGPNEAPLFDIAAEATAPENLPIDDDKDRYSWFWRLCMGELKLNRKDLDFTLLLHVIDRYALTPEQADEFEKRG